MDRVPGKLPNTSSRLIAMAASLVGDKAEVMAQMKCSEADFREYRAGAKEPNLAELDRLITLIIREQGTLIARNRDLLAKIRSRKNPAG